MIQKRKPVWAASILAALVAAGFAMTSSPGGAGTGYKSKSNIRGNVAILVKGTADDTMIVLPLDDHGEAYLAGLHPGEYSVRISEGGEESTFKVGEDGKLAFVAYEDIKTVEPQRRKTKALQLKAYRGPALPPPDRWTEQIDWVGPCRPPYLCEWLSPKSAVDLNNIKAAELARTAAIAPDAAEKIVADRDKQGEFTSIEDFARRICSQSDVDFSRTSIKLGDLVVILTPRASDKGIVPGFQCAREDEGQFSLYGKKHNYVGHVTLLR